MADTATTGCGRKVRTSPETTTSAVPGASWVASPTSKRARESAMCSSAQATKLWDESTPTTDVGLQRSRMAWVSAPVPQPTSTQRCEGLTSSQRRNPTATCRLQRPTYRSYAAALAHVACTVRTVLLCRQAGPVDVSASRSQAAPAAPSSSAPGGAEEHQAVNDHENVRGEPARRHAAHCPGGLDRRRTDVQHARPAGRRGQRDPQRLDPCVMVSACFWR